MQLYEGEPVQSDNKAENQLRQAHNPEPQLFKKKTHGTKSPNIHALEMEPTTHTPMGNTTQTKLHSSKVRGHLSSDQVEHAFSCEVKFIEEVEGQG